MNEKKRLLIFKKWWFWVFIAPVGLFIMLSIIGSFISDSENDTVEPTNKFSRIENPSKKQLEKIKFGLKKGIALSSLHVVKSKDFSNMYFVGTKINNQIAIWAIGGIKTSPNLIYSVNDYALTVSDWGDGRRTKAKIKETDDGIQLLKDYLSKSDSKKVIEQTNNFNVNKEIEVTFDGQDIINGKQKIVVWVRNNSKDIFTGNLSVTVKSKIDNSKLGSDYIFVEDLNPGQKTYAIIWVKPSNSASADYEWSSIKFIKDTSNVVNTANSPYKFLKDKTEDGGTFTPKIEFYLATDKDFDKMYQFIKAKKVNNGVFYHAVFVDDEKYVTFSKYPITAMTFDKEQSKHIIATYQYNTQNGYRNFTYYEKNSWESAPKTKKD